MSVMRNAPDHWFYGLRTARFASRRRLILGAVAAQAIILTIGWFWGFSLVRDRFEQEVREYIISQNADLTDDIAKLFPEMLPAMLTRGTQDWEELQSIVENLSDLPGEGFACLIDDTTGELLCHPDIRADESLYGTKLNFNIETTGTSAQPNQLALLDAPDEIISGRARVTPLESHYVATQRLGDSNLRLVVHQPKDALFRIGQDTTRTIALIASFVGVGILALSGVAVQAVVRRYDSFFEAANHSMTENLLLAQRIQQNTLPTRLPQPGRTSIAGWSQPADETGGDTFDAFQHANGHITLMLADATGHGVGAALSVTQLRAMLRMAFRSGTDLLTAATRINEQLHQDLPEGRFITAWLAEYDAASRTLRSLALGHGPVMIYRAATRNVQQLQSDTWPLGVMDDLGTEQYVTLTLDPGDIVVCVSDGITEASDPRGKQWGNDALEQTILQHSDDADALAIAIREAVEHHLAGHPADDDRSVLILQANA